MLLLYFSYLVFYFHRWNKLVLIEAVHCISMLSQVNTDDNVLLDFCCSVVVFWL